jgi:A/G-specific adenine glycosylase
MDYGAMLKSVDQNPNRRSAHYHRQAPFRDSDREIRGLILKILLGCDDLSEKELVRAAGKDTRRVKAVIRGLIVDELLERTGERLRICTSGMATQLQ